MVSVTRRLMRKPWSLAALLAAGGLLLIVAIASSGCVIGSHGEMHDAMHGIGDRPPQTPVVSEETLVSIEIRDYDFAPRDLTVAAGSSVTWTNCDSVPHDATDNDDSWGTGVLKEGESATILFDTPGTYEYLCTIHPSMTATLVVR